MVRNLSDKEARARVKKTASPQKVRAGLNVNSAAGDVEMRGFSGRARLGVVLWALLLCALLAPGCVETAECTASISCPREGEVCYESRCRPTCEEDAHCDQEQVCAPCQTMGGTNDPGKCFGEDLKACVEE